MGKPAALLLEPMLKTGVDAPLDRVAPACAWARKEAKPVSHRRRFEKRSASHSGPSPFSHPTAG
jgi:hypothetical protein